jgi:fermentation-respiration switch protein FrsA (DUF1100 family)
MRSKVIFALAACAALCGCTHLYFQPTHNVYADPASDGIKCEAIKFHSGDGTPLTGLFFAARAPSRGTVVHFHGNAENMTAFFPYSAWLAARGYNVFIFDYRGYGASGGTPTLDGLVMDGKAALTHALKLPGAETGRIIILGQSLGAAIAVAAVDESGFKPAAMVLEGAFYSYKGVGSASLRRHWWSWPISWLPWVAVSGRHSPKDHIGRITCPKIFIHSRTDATVPFSQGLKLYEAAPQPKELWITPYGHIEAFGALRSIYGPKLLDFLAALK